MWAACVALTDLPAPAVATAVISTLTAVWWVLEPIPVPVTSLLPLALLPMAGVLSHDEVAGAYGHKLILLLFGGSVMSTALERSGAHRRIALAIVRAVGAGSPRRLVLAFLLASAVLSMWISNTATALMLLPVALAVVGDEPDEAGLAVPLLLAITYGASIGGMGTPVGTPPNPLFMAFYDDMCTDPAYAELAARHAMEPLSFVGWMRVALPIVALLLPVCWLLLTRRVPRDASFAIPRVGAWTPAERRVLAIFGVVIVAWVTRENPWGGWSHALALPGAWDSSVALLGVVVLFLIPDGKGGALLDWGTARKIPWGLLLLFGGGLAIGKAFGTSGLATALGSALGGVGGLPVFVMVLAICLVVTFLTELTSNTATASLLMPILAGTALATDVDPKLLMIPATLSASCAFMLPVATAPNAVVYGSERVPLERMAREGLLLNLAAAVVIAVASTLILS